MVAENQLSQLHPGGEIIATGVSFEEYLEKFAGMHCELVGGNVIKMSPVSLQHINLTGYLYMLIAAYFELRPIGRVIMQPFTQRLPNVEPKREPDLLVVLNSNPHPLRETFMDGPADICIEIVSEESIERDRGTKFAEYQKGGVGEYWIIDSLIKESLFYRLGADGIYGPQYADEDNNYRPLTLPGLLLNVPTLWQRPLPGVFSVTESVKVMLAE
jgi:Uma2 family endonuclease